ncbi:hypothetical protein B0H14DRAFT_2573108 [Mycena olivaceomarginata]|nr:hypothetical protein B0H14DRAFT_2573108 [Mycena olivaceomarginata]
MQVRQLLIRTPGAHVPLISRSLPLLTVLSLKDDTLQLVRGVHRRLILGIEVGALVPDARRGNSNVRNYASHMLLDQSWVLNLNLLIPRWRVLVRRAAVLQTELDYPAINKHGQLLIPDFYSIDARPQEGTFGIGKHGEWVASDSYSICVLGIRQLYSVVSAESAPLIFPILVVSESFIISVLRSGALPLTRSRARHSEQLLELAPTTKVSVVFSPTDNTDTDDATGFDFVPEEKTTSPDSDNEFPSSLAIPANSGEMDTNEESTPPCRSRPSALSSSRGKMSPTKSPSKSACHAKSPSAAAPSCAATPNKSHIPDFTIRCDPTVPRPDRHTLYQFLSDVEIMETFKDPSLVDHHLEDSPPEVFDNPTYQISERGKWLHRLADGDHFVERFCRVYNGMRVCLLTFLHRFPAPLDPPELPADPNDPFYEHSEPKPERPPFVARPLKLSEPGNKKWESRADKYRRQLPIVRARQIESLALYRADCAKILDRIHRKGNTAGLPSNSGPVNFDDVPTLPIAAFAEIDSGSGDELPSGVTRVGPPRKGKMKAAASGMDREFHEGHAATPSARVAPGAALSARLEPSNSGPALAGGSSRTVSGAANVGENPEAGLSQVGDESPYDPEAWHAAHNPFDKHPFQTEVVLNHLIGLD